MTTLSLEQMLQKVKLSAPAQRALKAAKIDSFEALSKWSDQELLQLHGIGPTAIPKLKEVLSKYTSK